MVKHDVMFGVFFLQPAFTFLWSPEQAPAETLLHQLWGKKSHPLPPATDAPQGFTAVVPLPKKKRKIFNIFWSFQQVPFGEPTESLQPPENQGMYTQPTRNEGCWWVRQLVTSLETPAQAAVTVVKPCFEFRH